MFVPCPSLNSSICKSVNLVMSKEEAFIIINFLTRCPLIAPQLLHNQFDRSFVPQGKENQILCIAQMINLSTSFVHREPNKVLSLVKRVKGLGEDLCC